MRFVNSLTCSDTWQRREDLDQPFATGQSSLDTCASYLFGRGLSIALLQDTHSILKVFGQGIQENLTLGETIGRRGHGRPRGVPNRLSRGGQALNPSVKRTSLGLSRYSLNALSVCVEPTA